MIVKCEECDKEVDSIEFLFRHLRTHEMSAKDYILKWKYGNQIPTCACGCNGKNNWNVSLRDFTKFIHGHHAKGRIKSDDEKRRIGEKNSINMASWTKRYPDIAVKRCMHMSSFKTPESETKRIESTRRAYSNMSLEDKQKFSNHIKKLWNDGILAKAHIKASATFKQRSADGHYDFTERNDKISATITQRYLDGGFEWSTGQHTSLKTGKICNYRSSWELAYMQLLDCDESVEAWNYEPFSIPYIFEGVSRRYIPDFHVVRGTQEFVVEVKPDNLIGTPMNEAKREAAISFCEKNNLTYVTWSPT
jgi:hypothetical protein